MTKDATCPRCGSADTSIWGFDTQEVYYHCNLCLHKWRGPRIEMLPAPDVICQKCSQKIVSHFNTCCSISGQWDREARFFVCPHCNQVYYQEGDQLSRWDNERLPKTYYAGEAVDNGEHYLLIRDGRRHTVYTDSGPSLFRANLFAHRIPSVHLGYIDLDLETLRKKGSVSLVALLQSYLRNDLKNDLFRDEEPFLPARDIYLVFRALELLEVPSNSKKQIIETFSSRLKSMAGQSISRLRGLPWFLEEVFSSLEALTELGCPYLSSGQADARLVGRILGMKTAMKGRRLVNRILAMRTAIGARMWGDVDHGVCFNCLEKTFYAFSSLKRLGYSFSAEEVEHIKEALRDTVHFPKQGLFLSLKSTWAGVSLLLQIDKSLLDLPSVIRWLNRLPRGVVSLLSIDERNARKAAKLRDDAYYRIITKKGRMLGPYYRISTLRMLAMKPDRLDVWKKWLLSYILEPYWKVDPVDVATAILSLEMIGQSGLPALEL